MDRSFELLLKLVFAIFAQALFLARLQFVGCCLEQVILAVVQPLLPTLIQIAAIEPLPELFGIPAVPPIIG